MAKANKCDRCGKFFEYPDKRECEIVKFEPGYVPISYDLCDECYIKFMEWLKNDG